MFRTSYIGFYGRDILQDREGPKKKLMYCENIKVAVSGD
jgi:hypothetical protein